MIHPYNLIIYLHYIFLHIHRLLPTILINDDGTNGIYNNAAYSIIFYTSSTSALTIDSSQCLNGNRTGLTI